METYPVRRSIILGNVDHSSKAISSMEGFDGFINSLQPFKGMSNIRIQFHLTPHHSLDESRDLSATFPSSKSCSLPFASGYQLKWPNKKRFDRIFNLLEVFNQCCRSRIDSESNRFGIEPINKQSPGSNMQWTEHNDIQPVATWNTTQPPFR